MDIDRKNLLTNRAINLQNIANVRFKGKKKDFIETVRGDFGYSTIAKAMIRNSDKGCSDQVAHHIEDALGLPRGTLDASPTDGVMEVYYVSIATNAKYIYENVSHLQKLEQVKECSVVLGEYDIRIKVEVESQKILSLLLTRIDRLPGVKRSRTELAVKGLHWQKQQPEKMDILKREDLLSFTYGIEKYINRKIEEHFDAIEELEKGENIVIRRDRGDYLEHYEVIEGARKTLHLTRDPESSFSMNEKYIELEKKLINEHDVISRRIILIKDDYFKEENKKILNKVLRIYEDHSHRNSIIKFIFDTDWVFGDRLSKNFERFNIIDEKFICIKDDSNAKFTISKSTEHINKYLSLFYDNWDKSISIEDVREIIKLRKNSSKTNSIENFKLDDNYGISHLINSRINEYQSTITAHQLEEIPNKEEIKTLKSKIKDIKRGADVILVNKSIFLNQYLVIRGAQESIRSVRWSNTIQWYYDNHREQYNQYLLEENNLIKSGVISQRITFLPDNISESWNSLKFIYEEYNKIGCHMKFILKNEWVRTPSSRVHERFVILDKTYVCLKRDDNEHRSYTIKKSPERINQYIDNFDKNWSKSMTINQVEQLITDN